MKFELQSLNLKMTVLTEKLVTLPSWRNGRVLLSRMQSHAAILRSEILLREVTDMSVFPYGF